jgi:hypothetical protein
MKKAMTIAIAALMVSGMTATFAGEACSACPSKKKSECSSEKKDCSKDKGECTDKKAASDKA